MADGTKAPIAWPWYAPIGGVMAFVFGCALADRRDPNAQAAPEPTPAVQPAPSLADIEPAMPFEEAWPLALAATPPEQKPPLSTPDLVDIAEMEPTILIRLKYATDQNMIGQALYDANRAVAQRVTAEALIAAHQELEAEGLGIVVLDAYRPWHVTDLFWRMTPEELHQYVADPSRGSQHNRGTAVDVTLFDRATGEVLPMTSPFDHLGPEAHIDYTGGTDEQRARRDRLIEVMSGHGFNVYSQEWWHFNMPADPPYPVLNKKLSEVP